MDVIIDNITAIIALISFVAATLAWFIRTELKFHAVNKSGKGCYTTTEDVKDIITSRLEKFKKEIDKEFTEIKEMIKEEQNKREKLQEKIWNGK